MYDGQLVVLIVLARVRMRRGRTWRLLPQLGDGFGVRLLRDPLAALGDVAAVRLGALPFEPLLDLHRQVKELLRLLERLGDGRFVHNRIDVAQHEEADLQFVGGNGSATSASRNKDEAGPRTSFAALRSSRAVASFSAGVPDRKGSKSMTGTMPDETMVGCAVEEQRGRGGWHGAGGGRTGQRGRHAGAAEHAQRSRGTKPGV